MTTSHQSTDVTTNLLAAFAYLFGCLSGAVLLVLVRDDKYVRFHAMQSVLTFLGILVVGVIVREVPLIGRLLGVFLSIGTAVLWVFLMLKAVTGERFQLPYIGEIADRQN